MLETCWSRQYDFNWENDLIGTRNSGIWIRVRWVRSCHSAIWAIALYHIVLDTTLDNNTFKRLDHCISHRIQRRELILGPFSLEAPALLSELQRFGCLMMFLLKTNLIKDYSFMSVKAKCLWGFFYLAKYQQAFLPALVAEWSNVDVIALRVSAAIWYRLGLRFKSPLRQICELMCYD